MVNSGPFFFLSDRHGGFQPVQFGHLNIHEDHIEGFPLDLRYCFVSVARQDDSMAALFEQARGQRFVTRLRRTNGAEGASGCITSLER